MMEGKIRILDASRLTVNAFLDLGGSDVPKMYRNSSGTETMTGGGQLYLISSTRDMPL